MDFEYDFLDSKAYIAVNDLRKKHKKHFELIYKIVELINLIRTDNMCVKFNDDREKYIIATFYECYSTFSSEILLLERGLVTDFNILFRSFYEKKFKLFSVIKNKRNYKKILDEAVFYPTSLAYSILKNENKTFDMYQDLVKKDNYDFNILNKKQMSVESWARNAGLISEYDKQYTLLSEQTHYGVGSIVNKFKNIEDGKILYLIFSYSDLEENIILACYEMFFCILKFLDFFKCNSYLKHIDFINEIFDKLSKNN